jgi:uncharacterized protein DUF3268
VTTIVRCDYCTRPAELVSGSVLYPRRPDLFHRWFFRCKPCKAWVGTHKGSRPVRPLGRLANAELRELKQRVHAMFDPRWMQSKDKKGARTREYLWLAKAMTISPANCHVGMFSEDQCRAAMQANR